MNILDISEYYAGIITHKMVGVLGIQKYVFKDIEYILDKVGELGFHMVILQTCNRVEVYSYGFNPLKVLSKIGVNRRFCRDATLLRGLQVFKHLIHVVSGLDSLAVGENQVMGQVRKTYTYCKEKGYISRELEYLFNEAFKVGKRIRSKIVFKTVDYAKATIDLLNRKKHNKILIVGTGDLARDLLTILKKRSHIQEIYVAGRDGKSMYLADRYNVKPVDIKDLNKILSEFDAIVTCTSSPEPIINMENGDKLSPGTTLIDLGIPSNIYLPNNHNIELYNIEDISKYIRDRYKEIEDKVGLLYEYADDEVEELRRRTQLRAVEEIISTIYRKAERIRLEEYRETIKELDKLVKDPSLREELIKLIDTFSWSLIKKLYHHHIEVFRKLGSMGELDPTSLSIIIRLYASGEED